MATEFSLETIRAESEKRYGSMTIRTDEGPIVFRALLRLPDESISKVQELINQVNQISQSGREDFTALQEMDQHMREALKLSCGEPEQFETFAAQLDRADLLTVFELWSQGAQPGEA